MSVLRADQQVAAGVSVQLFSGVDEHHAPAAGGVESRVSQRTAPGNTFRDGDHSHPRIVVTGSADQQDLQRFQRLLEHGPEGAWQ